MFAPRAPEPEPQCPHHAPNYVCVLCLPHATTDGLGFIHRSESAGKLPLRRCKECGQLRTPGHWSHSTYWYCLGCRPLGSKKDPQDA